MSVALQAGSTISHYRVISQLGAGGMGEVYMARDESLERAVALKVLPPELVKNEERVRRFVQEAKSASSLSHPNIVTIYEIGKAEVSSDGSPSSPAIHFIAMELITGETLKHKIHHEKADLRTLLGHLAQAAEGLAKAHSAGIVHRDLKPENIMVSKDGFTKVLDFGLAKLSERADSPDDLTSLPTTAGEPTREGAIVGTINYMSPEQVRGKGVDHRSDVFSFGSILYEAATRKRPFVADSDVEIMHRILHDKPQPIEELNPAAPAALRRLVRRCLAKNPDQRLQSMKDLALELDEMVQEYDELSASAPSGSMTGSIAGTMASPKRRGVAFWASAAVAVVAVAALAFVAIRGLGTGGGGSSPYRNMQLAQLTRTGKIEKAVLSQDGKYLAYVVRDQGKYGLMVKQVATGSDVEISEPLDTPFRGLNFSPDGNYVYFVNQEVLGPGYSILYQVPSLGGPARKLLFDIDTAPAFSPDGSQIAFLRGFPDSGRVDLLIVNADGANERTLASRKDPESFWLNDCSWSPDGKRVATVAGTPSGAQVVTVDVANGKMVSLGANEWQWIDGLAWRPDGKGLIAVGADKSTVFGQVSFVSYPKGEVSRVTNDLNNYVGASVTADNAIATSQGFNISNLWSIPAADPGAAKQVTFGNAPGDGLYSLRSAGPGVLLYTGLTDKVSQIWSMREDGSARTQLTHGRPSYSPWFDSHGRQIFYHSDDENGLSHVWKMNMDGGHPTQVTTGAGEANPVVTPDGQWLYFGRSNEVWKMPLAGGEPTKMSDQVMLGVPQFSPDGRHMAYAYFGRASSGDRLERQVAIVPAGGGAPIETHTWPDRFAVRWMPAGNAISFVRPDQGASNIWSLAIGGGAPKKITRFESEDMNSYDWSDDGKTIYVTRGRDIRDVVLISENR